jgi:hypothetical protein
MPPPPVADPHATNILDNAYGAPPLGNAAARIGHAAKRATAARELEQTGNITEAELGEQEAFVIEESLATGIVGAGAAFPAGAPAWAVAMFAIVTNQFANVNNQLRVPVIVCLYQVNARLERQLELQLEQFQLPVDYLFVSCS